MKYCANCGNPLEDDALFCGNCGTRVDENQQSDMESMNANHNSQPGMGYVNANNNSQPAMENVNANHNSQPGMGYVNMNYNPQPGMYGASMNQNMQQSGSPQQTANTSVNPKVNKIKELYAKANKKVCAIVAAVVVVLIAGLTIYFNNANKININDYITVDYSGYDTVGTATYDFDEEAFMVDVLSKNGITLDEFDDIYDLTSSDYTKAMKIVAKYSSSDIICSLDKTSDLSNGDEVVLTVSVSDDVAKNLGVKLKSTKTKKYTVSDLAEIQTINPFDYITISYSGTSPSASASVKYTDDAESFIKSLYISLDKTSGISAGDTITATIKSDNNVTEKYGYVFSQTTQEYVCDDVDQYVTDISTLSSENLTSLQKNATDKIESYFANFSSTYTVNYTDLTYEGAYVLTRKTSSYSSGNIIYLIYSTNLSAQSSSSYYSDLESTKVYLPVKLGSVIVKADGTLKADSYISIAGYTDLDIGWSSVYGYTDGAKMYKELITANKDYYTYQISGNVTEFGN